MSTKTKKRAALIRKNTSVTRQPKPLAYEEAVKLTPKGETEIRRPGVPRFTASRDRIVVDQLKLKAADFNEWLEEAKNDGLTITDQAGNAVQPVQISDCVRRY
jgi:hypothetical protein